jgi:hypothetical protein
MAAAFRPGAVIWLRFFFPRTFAHRAFATSRIASLIWGILVLFFFMVRDDGKVIPDPDCADGRDGGSRHNALDGRPIEELKAADENHRAEENNRDGAPHSV